MARRLSELIAEALRLSGGERRELARAWFELPAVSIALRILPLRRLLAPPRQRPGAARRRLDDGPAAAREAARLVRAAARFSPLPSSCLTRSIVLWRLLRRRGVGAEIRIGVSREASALAAHAWIEVDGEPVSDAADVSARYAAFADRLPQT